ELLENTILPDLIKRKREENNYSLRIWSAGCSSGEEIYSIAMMLNKLIPDMSAWHIHLLGTDINTFALKKAITGCFNEWSMRSIDEQYKKRYFTVENKKYFILKKIQDMVTFSYLNLNEDTFPSILNNTNFQNLILCRNVLIYFDRDRGIDLIKKLNACLVPGGILILGASDPIYISDTDFILHYNKSTILERPLSQKKETILKIKLPVEPVNPTSFKKMESIQIEKPNEEKIKQLLKEAQWQSILSIIETFPSETNQSIFLLNAKAT